jgi:hypothetical protein
MDVAETGGGYRDVLRQYLYVAVYFSLLAVQACLCPGRDICGEAFPNIPRGDVAVGRPHARVGGPVEVFEYLLPKVSGHQRAECTGRGVADEVKVADLLRDDVQARAGAESMYLWAKDLAKGHVLQIQGCSVGDGCADPGGSGGGRRRAG